MRCDDRTALWIRRPIVIDYTKANEQQFGTAEGYFQVITCTCGEALETGPRRSLGGVRWCPTSPGRWRSLLPVILRILSVDQSER